ncbi:MAG: TIGR00341 family protein, partial [Muribaculaceae bacterium]|nr:TIGR00341 family protein [Muribaculaceae bacterium]
LCTAGYGLATGQSHFFFGALYLFFTNMIFILFATLIGVKLMGYKKVVYQSTKRNKRVQMMVYSVVGLTVAVSCFLTYQMIRKNVFMAEASEFVKNEMVFPNTQVLNHEEYISHGKRYIEVTLIGQALPKDSLQLAMLNKLDSLGLGGTVLNIKQGFSLETAKGDDDRDFQQFYSVMQQEIAKRQELIDSLRGVVGLYQSFNSEGVELAPEVKALFPSISDFALSRMIANSTSSGALDTLNMVFVNSPGGLDTKDRERLVNYLRVRLKEREVYLTLNPPGFPWPREKRNSAKK